MLATKNHRNALYCKASFQQLHPHYTVISWRSKTTHRFLSFIAPSLASLRACSSAFTRSIVARSRFSSFGSSQRRSALSRTSYSPYITCSVRKEISLTSYFSLTAKTSTQFNSCWQIDFWTWSDDTVPVCEPLWVGRGCSQGMRSSVSEPDCSAPRRPRLHPSSVTDTTSTSLSSNISRFHYSALVWCSLAEKRPVIST